MQRNACSKGKVEKSDSILNIKMFFDRVQEKGKSLNQLQFQGLDLKKRRKENNNFFSFNYKRKLKVRFRILPSSSPDRWERSLAWSTNNGDEARRRSSSYGSCLPTICSSSLSRFLTDSERSWPSFLSKYPASRHLVGRTSWRWGLGLSYWSPVFRQGAQWSVPYLGRGFVGDWGGKHLARRRWIQ